MYWNLFWFLSFLWYLIKINFDLGILYFVNKKIVFEVKWFISEERMLYYICYI